MKLRGIFLLLIFILFFLGCDIILGNGDASDNGNNNDTSETDENNETDDNDSIDEIPEAPSDLDAIVASDQVLLSWNDNANNESTFVVERSITSGSGFLELTNNLAVNTESYIDSSVEEVTVYYYRVKATNSVGDSGYSNELKVNVPTSNIKSLSRPLIYTYRGIDSGPLFCISFNYNEFNQMTDWYLFNSIFTGTEYFYEYNANSKKETERQYFFNNSTDVYYQKSYSEYIYDDVSGYLERVDKYEDDSSSNLLSYVKYTKNENGNVLIESEFDDSDNDDIYDDNDDEQIKQKVFTYNSEGLEETEHRYSNLDGDVGTPLELKEYFINTYDNGVRIKKTKYDSSDSVLLVETFNYLNDGSLDNVIVTDSSGNFEKKKIKHKNANGKTVLEKEVNVDGRPLKVKIYKFDSDNYKIQKIEFKLDELNMIDEVGYHFTLEYDGLGNLNTMNMYNLEDYSLLYSCLPTFNGNNLLSELNIFDSTLADTQSQMTYSYDADDLFIKNELNHDVDGVLSYNQWGYNSDNSIDYFDVFNEQPIEFDCRLKYIYDSNGVLEYLSETDQTEVGSSGRYDLVAEETSYSGLSFEELYFFLCE